MTSQVRTKIVLRIGVGNTPTRIVLVRRGQRREQLRLLRRAMLEQDEPLPPRPQCPAIHFRPSRARMKKTGVTVRFSFDGSVSVLPYVAVGIAIAVRVVSRVMQVLHVRVVSTKGIGGGGTLA